MKNRAKCKLCLSVIESYHHTDLVLCKCGEISVEGGDSMKCAAKSWNNFLRVDDEGNEIVVVVKGEESISKPNREDLLRMLEDMIKNVENLPQHAMNSPISHYDYCSLMILLLAIMREE